MAGGIVKPIAPKPREPRQTNQLNGALTNPPRLMEVGGLGKQARWNEDNLPWSQSAQVNRFDVKQATGVKVAKKSTDTND